MPCWYYEKKELRGTPSLHDGIDFETESRYRKEGARFIIDTGTKMDLGYNTMATGVVYFHRFYMFHSFRDFPRYVTACCCLFLAGKVEETPKKCKDIIKTARGLLTDQKFLTFGDDPKEEVMTLERILLQTIKFDLQVEHPYNYLLKYAKCLKGDKVKLQKMVQMAWTFVNDSLCTTLSLQWEPEVIAVALMYLAGKLSKFEVVDWMGRASKHLRWWDMFVEDVTMDLLEDICHQVLDLYSQPAVVLTCDSPPLVPLYRSPRMRRERMPQPISPVTVQHSPPPVPLAHNLQGGQAIPVKVSKPLPLSLPLPLPLPMSVDEPMADVTDSVSKALESAASAHYQYGSYAAPAFVPGYPAPAPTQPPPYFPHQYPGAQYYQPPPPRPYYPPQGPL